MMIDPGALENLFKLICAYDGPPRALIERFAMMRGLTATRAEARRFTVRDLDVAWRQPGALGQMGVWRTRFQGHCFYSEEGGAYLYVVVREQSPTALVLIRSDPEWVHAEAVVDVGADEAEAEEIERQIREDLATGPARSAP